MTAEETGRNFSCSDCAWSGTWTAEALAHSAEQPEHSIIGPAVTTEETGPACGFCVKNGFCCCSDDPAVQQAPAVPKTLPCRCGLLELHGTEFMLDGRRHTPDSCSLSEEDRSC